MLATAVKPVTAATANYRNSDQFLDEQWAFYRLVLDAPVPQTDRETCLITREDGFTYRGHGGGWDRWEWRGESYQAERAYCTHCGTRMMGEISPWKEAALQDWYNTPYMQAQRRKWGAQNAYCRLRRVQRFPHKYTVIPA